MLNYSTEEKALYKSFLFCCDHEHQALITSFHVDYDRIMLQ